MAVRPKTHADAVAPAEPVPVAMLGRTSTLELQDPYGSMARQITSAREWLPEGFYLAGYYWDIESGGLALEKRGHAGNYQPFVAKGLPRDGGLADLLAEARSPAPRFAAVVCEDIARSGRDTFNALKLERELGDNGILLFATDEPIDLDGTDPATILLRRTKQNIAEYFRLSLKQSMWRGMRTHAAQGYNLGKVIDGYLPEKIPHPAPSKAAQGRTKTRLVLDEQRAPIIAAIYQMRAWEKLGVPTIHARLTADPATYPAPDPETGWTLGGLYSILANPKYTGYQVFGRRRKGRPVPAGKWYWPGQPTHPGHRGPRHLGDRPEGRGRAPQRTRRGHAHPGQLAHLPVPVPRPLQDLHAAHVRPAQGAPAPQDPHRAHLLRVPVQPGHPPARRRRPRPPPHRPGPRRLPQSRNLQRPIRLRAGPRPRTTPRAAASRPRPPRKSSSTTGRPPPWTNGSSASPPPRTT